MDSDLDKAAKSHRQALAKGADNQAPLTTAEEDYVRAVQFWNDNKREEATQWLDRALGKRPDFAEALCMGGYMLEVLGKPDAGLNFYQRALQIKGDMPVAWSNSGKILFSRRRFADALFAFEKALALTPNDADIWNCLSGVYRELGRLNDSIAAATKSLSLFPGFAEAALNLGNALLKLDRIEEALDAYKTALNGQPEFARAHCGLALALKALGRYDEALAHFDEADRLGSEEAKSGKGCLHLLLGDFEQGWEGYEARWLNGKSLREALGVRFPQWRGLEDDAKRVLVLNDHGLGDTIQFCRYLRLMTDTGLDVTFLCPKALHRLLSGLGVALRETLDPNELFDAQIPLSSLPRAFRTRLDTIPATTPYLKAEETLCEKVKERLGSAGFRIGIVWQGNPNPEADMARSAPLAAFKPLALVSGVRLISLQKGFGLEQLASLSDVFNVETLGEDIDVGPDAFVETAAAIMQLDLIVTCDTSIAHLAGALGRPVWVALKWDAEWRWLRERQDSPWYPSMRLFRQKARGDWDQVFDEIAEEARKLICAGEKPRAIAIPGSVGELFDKITILEIKARRLQQEAQLANVKRELALLKETVLQNDFEHPALTELKRDLSATNERLWQVEDDLRICEKVGDFGAKFVELAREVYRSNDHRAAVKLRINQLFNSAIIEEKSYAEG